jgi:hypothetical protein
MKRATPAIVALAFILGIWLVRWAVCRHMDAQQDSAARPREVPAADVAVTAVATPASAPAGHDQPLLGETILRNYANTNMPLENDLTLMSHLMENALLLLKSAARRPLSANEDWAALFLGRNAAQESFLPAQHAALDSRGRLVDRWRTPLWFHALGGGRYEVRSAGLDRILWTGDDLQRNADGSFHRGAALIPDSRAERPRI